VSPATFEALKNLDAQFAPPRQAKGYSLSKVINKHHGFLYYVRYLEKGQLVTSRWNTYTSNIEAAKQFALDNRERILSMYHEKHDKKTDFYGILKSYYKENSVLLAEAVRRGRTLSRRVRMGYDNCMCRVIIPFLKRNGAHVFSDVTAATVVKLQNTLLSKGIVSATVNRHLSCISTVYDHMILNGMANDNPFNSVTRIKQKNADTTARGCYDIEDVYGAFNRVWKDRTSYLLCLMIYGTGMRNSEIEKIQLSDFIKIGHCRFIDIPQSKTSNGVRIVPLHDYIYDKVMKYAEPFGDYVFSKEGKIINAALYREANKALARRLKVDESTLEEQNITFYSGRHYWKTLMNAHDLGDIEEYFMGHKVSSDVAKRYNHRDRQGQKVIVAKAREVFKILDKTLLRTR
jgi:integrase